MNPLAKAVGTVLALAAGTLGTSLGADLDPLGLLPPLPTERQSDSTGNATGNETAGGNQTTSGNQTGNATGNGNQTAGGNQTGNATGNQTAGNETAENETAEPEPTASEPVDAAVCDFYVDERGDDLTGDHHEWEWRVNGDVTHLYVSLSSFGSVGLGGQSEARLIDGQGRTLARTSGEDGGIYLSLERGNDYLANGLWRLVYDSSDLWSSYSVSIHVGCAEDDS